MKLPTLLETRLKEIYTPEEMAMVDEAFSLEKRKVSFRINTLKSSAQEVESALLKKKISFSKQDFLPNCYILETGVERDLWNLDIYKEWYIYIQSIASQMPVEFLELTEWMTVLDVTAAPGGKTSQISERVWEDGKVVACELSTIRREKMTYNLQKLWCTNVEIVGWEAQKLSETYTQGSFDAMLFDAPCSSEGSISYNDETFLTDWSMRHIDKNYQRQKDILKQTVWLLKNGWVLVYSTCTLAPEENESIVHYILCNFKELEIQEIHSDFPYTKPWILKFWKYVFTKNVALSMRIVPNPISEWFFIAKFRKKS